MPNHAGSGSSAFVSHGRIRWAAQKPGRDSSFSPGNERSIVKSVDQHPPRLPATGDLRGRAGETVVAKKALNDAVALQKKLDVCIKADD
ncbi:hypothetical protein [Streptomyces canus]|uniref:hypothetical protein n=1 Tax=Streptomyces canus TaxID=58343 RepID=UPI003714A180